METRSSGPSGQTPPEKNIAPAVPKTSSARESTRFVSIRTRLLALFLGTAIITVIILALLAFASLQNLGQQARTISGQSLRQQAEYYLVQLTEGRARENDQLLNRVSANAQSVAAYMANIFNHPADFTNSNLWLYDREVGPGSNGIQTNSRRAVTSIFIPNTQEVTDQVRKQVELGGYFELVAPATFSNTPNVQAVYFATPNDVLRYYPNIGLGEVLPADYQATKRDWYLGSMLRRNPKRIAWWTPVYRDATGLGLVTTMAMPLYGQGQELHGVVGFDVTLDTMRNNIEAAKFLQSGYSFLVDQTGKAIALPAQGFQDILGRQPEKDELNPDLAQSPTGFAPVINRMMAGQKGFETINVNGRELLVAYTPLKSTGWSLGSVAATEEVLSSLVTLQSQLAASTWSVLLVRVLPLVVVILIVVGLLGLVLTNRLVLPIQKLAVASQKIGAGEWDVEIPPTSNDEIGLLADTIGSMAHQLREIVSNLENLVSKRTSDLERRALQLQVAAEVARESGAIRDLEQLLENTVHLISDRFAFYHAGIFMLDDQREYAVLRAASSEGGHRMLARGHKLKAGEVGIVGYVAAHGMPRIALDVGTDAVFFNNPDLPETRSEAALPLRAYARVIGVLDVQSKNQGAFTQEDIQIFQILADQVALAIENVRLLTESQRAFRELEQLYGERIRQDWRARLTRRPLTYHFDRTGISAVPAPRLAAAASRGDDRRPDNGSHLDAAPGSTAAQQEAVQPGTPGAEDATRVLQMPLELRGQRLGTIMLRRDPDQRAWLPQEEELVREMAAQIALALENARLLEVVQRRAHQEQLVGEIAAKAQSSLDLDSVMKATVQEIGMALRAARVQIRLGNGEKTTLVVQSNTAGEYAAEYHRAAGSGPETGSVGKDPAAEQLEASNELGMPNYSRPAE